MKRLCLNCGKELTGRADQKFCDSLCRSQYHNIKKNESNAIRNRIITALNKNYRILSNLIASGRDCAELSEMEQLGFIPSCITSVVKGDKTHDEFVCYDITYCQTCSRIFDIRRNELLGLHLCSRLGNVID